MTTPAASRVDKAAAWIYRGFWSGIVDWLRVPPLPDDLPSRAGEAAIRFHPALGFLRYLKFWFWLALLPEFPIASRAEWAICPAPCAGPGDRVVAAGHEFVLVRRGGAEPAAR